MKTLKNYFGILFFISTTTTCFFISCNKKDSTHTNKTAAQEKENAIKRIQQKYGSVAVPEVYAVNKIADGFYVNPNGEEIPLRKKNTGTQSVLTCTFDCNTATDPSDLDLTYTLGYIQRFFYCGSTMGSEVTATWFISVPYTVLLQNPYNPALKSKGRMRFLNSSGGLITSNTNLQPITITANGPDPNCGTNFLYTVTYKWSSVADSYFSNGNILECSLFAYNDCDLTANNYLTSWTKARVFQGTGTYAQPCNRIDKVWYNVSTGNTPSQCATAGGAYVTCPAYPAGFTPTFYQQVQYRRRDNPNSYVWDDQASPIEIGETAGTNVPSETVSACCGVLFLRNIYQGQSPGGWLIRYRNRHTGCDNINDPWTSGTYMTEFYLY